MSIEYRAIESLKSAVQTEDGRNDVLDHLNLLLEDGLDEYSVESIYATLKLAVEAAELRAKVYIANDNLRKVNEACLSAGIGL